MNNTNHSSLYENVNSKPQNGKSEAKIPSHLLEEANQLRETQNKLVSRMNEVEKCNLLFESQLAEFRQYINSTGDIDVETKRRLENKINEAEKLLDLHARDPTGSSGSLKLGASNYLGSLGSELTATAKNSSPVIQTAADKVNNALESLIGAFESCDVRPESDESDLRAVESGNTGTTTANGTHIKEAFNR